MGRGTGGGARVSDLFFTKYPNLKKNLFFLFRMGRGGGGLGGVGGGARVSEIYYKESKFKRKTFFFLFLFRGRRGGGLE